MRPAMRVPSIGPSGSRVVALGVAFAVWMTTVAASAETPADPDRGHQPSGAAALDHLRSPYATLPGTGVTGLLPQEVEALIKGDGMALAMAAELNGYPGPRHLLDADAAGQLDLRADQRDAIRHLYDRMLAEAKGKGQEILRAEEGLAARFRHAHVDEASLGEILDQIGRLRTELRRIHLRTHLDARALLTPDQIARYKTVRGYDASGGHQRGH